MNKQIQICGTYRFKNRTSLFNGTVIFHESDNLIYYTWSLKNAEGQFMGGKSRPIAFQKIPFGQDRIEFSEAHALEGIGRFRIGREKIIQEVKVI